MIEIRREPTRRDLVVFGALLGPVVAFLGWTLVGAFGSDALAFAVWGVGGAIWLAFLAVPPARKRIYVGWILAVYPIGWTVSHLIVFVVYYLVVTPVGLALRLFAKDPMRRRFDEKEPTYWTAREPVREKERYFRQF